MGCGWGLTHAHFVAETEALLLLRGPTPGMQMFWQGLHTSSPPVQCWQQVAHCMVALTVLDLQQHEGAVWVVLLQVPRPLLGETWLNMCLVVEECTEVQAVHAAVTQLAQLGSRLQPGSLLSHLP